MGQWDGGGRREVKDVGMWEVGLANSKLFSVIALVPLSSKENHFCFHKIEFVVVILSMIDFLRSK